MSCFWDSLIQSISNEDKTNFFNNNINPIDFAKTLKQKNTLTLNVTWNNENLTTQFLDENKQAIDSYDTNTIYNGYYCSTCEPFLFLLCELLNIEIQHNYNNNLMIYKHIKNNRYIIKINSDNGHCWR
jgi:hypothetical protein